MGVAVSVSVCCRSLCCGVVLWLRCGVVLCCGCVVLCCGCVGLCCVCDGVRACSRDGDPPEANDKKGKRRKESGRLL